MVKGEDFVVVSPPLSLSSRCSSKGLRVLSAVITLEVVTVLRDAFFCWRGRFLSRLPFMILRICPDLLSKGSF